MQHLTHLQTGDLENTVLSRTNSKILDTNETDTRILIIYRAFFIILYQASNTVSTHRLYIRAAYRHHKNCNNPDFTPFYFKLDNFNVLKILLI